MVILVTCSHFIHTYSLLHLIFHLITSHLFFSETSGASDMEFDKQQLEHFLTVSKVDIPLSIFHTLSKMEKNVNKKTLPQRYWEI